MLDPVIVSALINPVRRTGGLSSDDDELELWPTLFVQQGCRYQVIPRENLRQDPPMAILMCDSHGMMRDRIRSLREGNVYNLHFPRRQITNIDVLGERDGEAFVDWEETSGRPPQEVPLPPDLDL